MITIELLQTLCPQTSRSILQGYIEPLNTVGEYYEMFENIRRISGFLAQVSHESGGFRFIEENLNYSVKGLLTTFRKYFPTEELAKQYAKNPEKIANRVYANRMKNGDELSGDGYRYRGRGLIQLTGKDNYMKFSEALGIDLDSTVSYLSTPNGAVSSAGWFWDNNKLNQYCDRGDFIGLTKRINGGTFGLAEREHYYNISINFLSRH